MTITNSDTVSKIASNGDIKNTIIETLDNIKKRKNETQVDVVDDFLPPEVRKNIK